MFRSNLLLVLLAVLAIVALLVATYVLAVDVLPFDWSAPAASSAPAPVSVELP